jgi:hypothetical protein
MTHEILSHIDTDTRSQTNTQYTTTTTFKRQPHKQ